ncbi:SAM-dependent methyltransferase [Thermomonospora umbrina]|uniref:S-adenosyl methyltransferase n=1 Tax=Thermomonospora umbrina TaxID=111806 RepID=A0A3D9SYD7_9ACTN|nr:SAM-dependent methyltransferase [Thermomonospora umbrina]REF00588.1 S-adenosyl methyltransferase [Thermomonospora umbrina]
MPNHVDDASGSGRVATDAPAPGEDEATSSPDPPPDPFLKDDCLDTTRPNRARVWDHWSGGKDTYPVDRDAGDAFLAAYPQIGDIARVSRAFRCRVVRFLAAECGVRQFVDIDPGLPLGDHTQEVAQRVEPSCRTVYADGDALVMAHARALLTSDPGGVCGYVHADITRPDLILAGAAEPLDLDQPVAVLLINVLGHVPDFGQALAAIRHLTKALAPGSFLAVSDLTDTSPELVEATGRLNEQTTTPYTLRSPDQIAGLLEGLEPVEPGMVTTSRWRPEPGPWDPPDPVDAWCGLGRTHGGAAHDSSAI